MMDSKFENMHSFTEILHLVSYGLLSNLVRQTLGESERIEHVPRAFALRSTTLKSSIPAYDQRTITLMQCGYHTLKMLKYQQQTRPNDKI